MTAVPAISVGMPVYNGERYVELTIRAVLGQTLEDFELIISDNCSTDRTAEICQDLASTDARIRYVCNDVNIGAARNYNRVFQLGRAPYFRWMNADDLCTPTLHERCHAALESRPDAVLAYGKTAIIDAEGRVTAQYEDNLDLPDETPVARFRRFSSNVGMTNAIYGLMRRDIMARTALMGQGSYPAADTNFMGELSLYGKFIELPEVLFMRRMHPQASSWERRDVQKQQKFWTGTSAAFRWPHWKRHAATLAAIQRAPLRPAEKLRLQGFALRRMLWTRQALLRDVSCELRRLTSRART